MEAQSNRNQSSGKPNGPDSGLREFVRWAMTPPQAVGVYLVVLLMVAGLSFYVGTLKPKKPIGIGPPPLSSPRN